MVKRSSLFPTQEIGSITKPGWRVKGVLADGRITSKDVEEASSWGERLKVPDYERLVNILRRISTSDSPITEEDKISIRDFSVKYVLALFDNIGLDRVYSANSGE